MKKIVLFLVCILLMGNAPNAWADDLEWLLDITQKATHISDKEKDQTNQVQIQYSKAHKGDALGQYQLGKIYQNIGWRFKNRTLSFVGSEQHQFNESQNNQTAIYWYLKSAEQGNVKAQYELGFIYLTGIPGVEKDGRKAKLYFEKAAQQGNADALLFLGGCYEDGTGTAPDINKAIQLYHEAVDKGQYTAYFRLHLLYYFGKKVPQDLDRAEEYERKYCELAKKNHDPLSGSCQ